MEHVSLYLSKPNANFTLKYESVAVELLLGQSIEEVDPICQVLLRESGR